MFWIFLVTFIFMLWIVFWMGSMLYASVFHVPTVYSSDQAITDALKLAGLKEGELVIDLGCGNAKSLIIAAKAFKAKGLGVENSLYCVIRSRLNIWLSGEKENVRIVFGDFKKVESDLAQADVVYLYLLNTVLAKIEPWYFKSIGRKTRTVTLGFWFASHKPLKTITTKNLGKNSDIRLYKDTIS